MVVAEIKIEKYIDISGGIHVPPGCVIEQKVINVNSSKIDPSSGDPLPTAVKRTVCTTHGDRPVSPNKE